MHIFGWPLAGLRSSTTLSPVLSKAELPVRPDGDDIPF